MSHALLLLCLGSSSGAFAEDKPFVATGEGAWDERAQEHRVRATLHVWPDESARVIRLGVLIQPDEHWHVYWQNSGESGLATAIDWSVGFPDGEAWTSGEMTWPVPEVFTSGGGVVTTFGYDEVLHTVNVPWPEGIDAATAQIDVTARANYLTCEVECIPGDQRLGTSVALDGGVAADVQQIFERYEALLPTDASAPLSPLEINTQLSQSALRVGDEGTWRLSITPCSMRAGEQVCVDWKPDLSAEAKHIFLPELVDGVVLKVKDVSLDDNVPDDNAPDRILIDVGWRVTATSVRADEVTLAGVLRMRDEGDRSRPFRVTSTHAMVERGEPVKTFDLSALNASPDKSQEVPGVIEDVSDEAPTLLYALWLAFIGGLLLNIMPCVLPVLSIKIAGVAQIAHHSRGQMLRHGAAYTLGILSSMGALALVVIAMRQVGMEVGWGFQFQSPLFLLGLLGGLTLFAVNVFGAFDIGAPMGNTMQQLLHDRRDEGGELRKSFLEGIACVVLATPCSAPFMGTAVGFALASHGVVVASIFLMLGLGLALPFVVLCALPGWAKLLPKPGAWLDVLKVVMGMGLLVTCVWLLWLLGQGQGVDGMAIALLWMCGLAAAGVLYGLVQYRTRGVKWTVVGLLCVAIVAGFWASASQMKDVSEVNGDVSHDARWQVFDEEAIARDVEAGKVVFVDFTADWCITCKVNENGVLMDETLLADARKLNVVWYKADWTHRDDRIRAILKRYGKGGVPMYLIHGKKLSRDGLLLPELLTVDMVREGLESAHP